MSRTSATFHGHYFNEQDEQISHELRGSHIVCDLDAFLATKGDERAATWRTTTLAGKRELVGQMMTRYELEVTDATVAAWIAKYDAKWGSEPTTIEAAVLGELGRMAADHADYARTARAAGDKATAKEFQRAANAYANAAADYARGIRPELLPGGRWMLPSHRAGEAAHILTKDGDWVCSCQSGAQIHWASALIIGIELAELAMDRDDAGDVEPEAERPTQTPAQFGARLANARIAYLRAA